MKKVILVFNKEDFEKILGMKTYGLIGFENDPDSVGVFVEDEDGTEEAPYKQKGLVYGE